MVSKQAYRGDGMKIKDMKCVTVEQVHLLRQREIELEAELASEREHNERLTKLIEDMTNDRNDAMPNV